MVTDQHTNVQAGLVLTGGGRGGRVLCVELGPVSFLPIGASDLKATVIL